MTPTRHWSPNTAALVSPAARHASNSVGTAGPSFHAGTSRPVSGTQLVTMPWSRGPAPVAKVAWFGYVDDVITDRACRGCAAHGPSQRSQDRRVIVADVPDRQRVEHGEHDLHAGRPSKSPMIETRARSPGRVPRTRCASSRSTRRGDRPRVRRCTWGTTRGGGDPSGWRDCGAEYGCGTTACDRPPGPPVPTRAWRRSPDRCTRGIGGQHRSETARDHFEATVVGVGVVDRDHCRHVRLDHRVRGRVLVRRVSGATRELVVDLLLVEHGRLIEQGTRDVDERSGAEQLAQSGMHLEELFAATQLGSRIGRFAMLEHTRRFRKRGDLVDPRREPRARAPTGSASTTTHPCSRKCLTTLLRSNLTSRQYPGSLTDFA